MTFESRSLIVTFDEDDQGVWETLQSLTSEQQTLVIKQALTQYLKEHPEVAHPDTCSLQPINERGELASQSEWNLDTLFISSPREELQGESEQVNDPLRYLFDLIGEEEDEDVLQLLGAPGESHSSFNLDKEEETSSEQAGMMPSPTDHDRFEIVQQHEIRTETSKGLNFIVQHVIGEEDDEEVLQFFESE